MKISLITCVYNTAPYLKRCFDSINKQNYDDYEVIVINDGSKDDSQEIINEYVNMNSKFVSFIQENCGQAVARNKGIEMAKGDYIVFVDSDDELKENYLLLLSKAIDRNLDFGYARMSRVYDKKTNFLERSFKYIHVYDSEITNISDTPEAITKISNSPCAKIFRKKFLLDNNITFYPKRLYEDLLFISCVLLSNPKTMYINDDSYIYHIHEGTSMTGNGQRVFEIFDVFDAVIDFARKKRCFEYYHEELEYLAFYHIGIGTMYRYFCYKPFGFFYCLKKCRNYIKRNSFSVNNKYIEQMSLLEKIYIKIFFK